MADDLIRPGPERILPGLVPGGVVIHVYAVPTCRHLLTRQSRSVAETEHYAPQDADQAMNVLTAHELGVCLVAYDGDTGERMGADAWTS